jgi:hypothetical protein
MLSQAARSETFGITGCVHLKVIFNNSFSAKSSIIFGVSAGSGMLNDGKKTSSVDERCFSNTWISSASNCISDFLTDSKPSSFITFKQPSAVLLRVSFISICVLLLIEDRLFMNVETIVFLYEFKLLTVLFCFSNP